MRTTFLAPSLALSLLALVGCGPRTGDTDAAAETTTAGTPSATSSSAAPSSRAPASPPASAAPAEDDGSGTSAEGTVVRFSGGGTSVDVTIGPDTPTTRDFVSLLPFTTQLEDLSGREKIGDPPRALDVEGTPGSDPEDGDLIYFTPWGNLGFYYDATGIEYSDSTPHLGTYQATEDQLAQLEGQDVTVEVVG